MAVYKVLAVGEVKKSPKNGREYKTCTFAPAKSTKFVDGIEVDLTGADYTSRIRNVWGELKNDKGVVVFKADSNFATIAEGKCYEMNVDQFITTEYVLNGRKVNKLTTFTYGAEDAVAEAMRQMKAKGGQVICYMDGTVPAQVALTVAKVDKSEPVAETAKA
jgi:hypothetical protein